MTGHPVAARAGQLLPSSRYRHPGDVIRLISGGIVLACALIASAAASRWLLGPAASTPPGLGSGTASRVLTGLVQVACVAAAALVVTATLRRRRFRLLGGLAIGVAAAALAAAGIFYWIGGQHPDALAANLAHKPNRPSVTRSSARWPCQNSTTNHRGCSLARRLRAAAGSASRSLDTIRA